ncbi:hypothetical protein [uncultured Flavobacterium sp.]|uniref:hypothetical protein n=1 Tax=uncultured Flavobacterium sp. TaxID=165435 RepID=UPI0025D8194B|nr:hypothetical protein [uncultured Flavobacterium sp.]
MNNSQLHTFHIPVMGLAYTIDSPIRVAQFGISSVISIMDDDLMEKLNAFYSKKFHFQYEEITQKIHDFRAKRITSYLNLVDKIVKEKFEKFKAEIMESKTALENYIAMLPNQSEIKLKFQEILQNGASAKDTLLQFIEKNLVAGDIDVNIMTKVDKENFSQRKPLPSIFNDAHAALRGFANSDLESSVVFSAGMNPSLYGYLEDFSDFFPDENYKLKKKIMLKVSDFRSAMIQGNYLAKKGLWVSEYRIESGLNCGGHAFATDGFLLGFILEEFKNKKLELVNSAHELMIKALLQKGFSVPDSPLELKITVQGGVGTSEEHEFLLNHYKVDSVGWGSPFLLVPEATSVDAETRKLLSKATENELFLSHISPLGIPFNSVKGTTNEALKQHRISQGKFGSSCPKKYLELNKEFSGKAICTASRKYQEQKLNELEEEKSAISETEFIQKRKKILEKSCLCVGLSNASLIENNLPLKGESQGIVVCPGPNMAYFTEEISLLRMIKHIYGNDNVISVKNRPHFFMKELKMYTDYLKKEIENSVLETSKMAWKKIEKFRQNLLEGIQYYENIFTETTYFQAEKETILLELQKIKNSVESFEAIVL